MGVAALAVSAGGAVSAADADLVGQVTSQTGAMAAAGSTGLAKVAPIGHRDAVVSRDSRRDALADAANEELIEQAEAQAEQQHAALEQFAKAAEKQSAKIKENQWILPLESYRITATFGTVELPLVQRPHRARLLGLHRHHDPRRSPTAS